MTRLVVTGAAGFLGSAVVTCLRERDLPVTAVSRRALPGVHQVTDYADTPAGDVIIHLAENPDRAQVNGRGDAYAEHAARVLHGLADRCGRLVYASSGVVYGDQHAEPFSTRMPVVASDTYSASKLRNEELTVQARGIVARLSNLYGQGMSKNNVLSDIARQLAGTGPLQVRDDRPVRDFLRVEDAALALALMATRNDEALASMVFNVGSGEGLSIRELAELALRASGRTDLEIVATRASLPANLSVNVLDIDDTRHHLGWAPAGHARDQLSHFFQNGVTLDD